MLKWNGPTWALQTSGAMQSPAGGWAANANTVWTVGTGGTIQKWNGAAWVAEVSGAAQDLRGMWGAGANNVWAVGNFGTILHKMQ